MSSVKQNIGGDEQMCLRRRPFRWSCGGVEAKHVASPDAACPGLHRKPLNSAIRLLLAPYRPGGRHGDNQQMTMQNVPTLLAILMAIAMRRYYTAHIAWWRRFVAFIKATKRHHRASTCSDITNRTCQRWLILLFHREKGLQLTCWPQYKWGCDMSNWREPLSKTIGYLVGMVNLACYSFKHSFTITYLYQ